MPDAVAKNVSEKLALLRQRFRDKAAEEIDVLAHLIESIRSGNPDPADVDAAYRLLHRLAGSAGTFGFTHLGEEARRLELFLKPMAEGVDNLTDSVSQIDDEFCDHLAGLKELLRDQDAIETNQPSANPFDSTVDEHKVLVFDPDKAHVEDLIDSLKLYGYPAKWLQSTEGWRDTLKGLPSVVIIQAGQFLAGSAHFSNSYADIPIICVGRDDSFSLRYALAKAGAEAYFCEPLNSPMLTDHLERLVTDHADAVSGRVLIVDDDPELLEHYRLVLTTGGMDARTVSDPAELLPTLSEFRPDILLMDVQMGQFSGPALARMLRFEPEWLSLPIVYLSSESDREIQLEALAKGGDDFLTKPVSDSFLLRTVRIRCYRAKQLDKLVSRDSLTGLLKHSLVKSEVAKEHARSMRMKHPSVVAMLDLDHFKQVNDTQGHRAGDLVIKGLANLLRHRLRKTDIIGRYGGEEFVVALPDCNVTRAGEVLQAICEDFSKITFRGNAGDFNVTLSIGAADLSGYYDAEDAIEAADQALYERKRFGRNGVSVAKST